MAMEAPQGLAEPSQEVRAAHRKAFKDATAAVEAEIVKSLEGHPGQAFVQLTSLRDEFEAWEEEAMDGPMPPMATVDSLRARLLYAMVDEQAWKAVPDYAHRIEKIEDSHMGGGTSMSYKFFALFRKGLAAVRSALRSSSDARAVAELVALTLAMKDNDEWYGDTDLPEEVVSLVKTLGELWGKALVTAAAQPSSAMIRAWLALAKQEWEGEAADHIDAPVRFNFEPKPTETPEKGAKAELKRKAPPAQQQAAKAAKAARTSAASRSEEVDAWTHRLDGELARRQASVVQIRAETDNKKRAIIVSGSYPVKAVGFALAEAFGVAVDAFDPHPNKGKSPPGLCFTIRRGDAEGKVLGSLKIVQALQEPGDEMRVDMEGLSIKVSLDLIKFKGSASAGGISDDGLGWSMVRGRPMPRCVGGDRGLTPGLLKRLNTTFLGDRQGTGWFPGDCSKKEMVEATVQDMARPIALEPGAEVQEFVGDDFLPNRKQVPIVF